jgi:hypothetical protein
MQPHMYNNNHGYPMQPNGMGAPTPAAPAAPAPNHYPAQAYHSVNDSSRPEPVNPSAVVQVLSPMGVEYVFMTISLFAAAGGLAAALIALVNGKTDFTVLAFPTALLLVSVPVFALLFLHAKKQELLRPVLRQDPSKRRSTQLTQIICFIISLFTLVGFVTSVFAKLGGQSDASIGKVLLDCLVLLVVFGGILAYYWRDEHTNR